MPVMQDTAYPMIPSFVSKPHLQKNYYITKDEMLFLKQCSYDSLSRIMLGISLKTIQHLGYFIPLHQLPPSIIDYVQNQIDTTRKISFDLLQKYEDSGNKRRQRQFLRNYLGIKSVSESTRQVMRIAAERSATTKDNMADIINEMIEELVAQRFELPAFSSFERIAISARNKVNQSYYQQLYDHTPLDYRQQITTILSRPEEGERSLWQLLKMEPKKPTTTQIRLFTTHLIWLQSIHQDIEVLQQIPNSKKERFIQEALALDVSTLRKMSVEKQHSLVITFIDYQSKKALDDIADMFIKTVSHMKTKAQQELNAYYLGHTENVNELVGRFKMVLQAYRRSGKMKSIHDELAGDSLELLGKCDQHIAATSNNYYLYLLPIYQNKRSLLFNCVELLPLASTTSDNTLLKCLTFIQQHRAKKKEWLEIMEDEVTLDWLPEKARKLVTGYTTKSPVVKRIHKKYFEICVFTEIANSLKSLDLCVQGSLEKEDYRKLLLSEQEYIAQLPEFEKVVEYPVEAGKFVDFIAQQMHQKALHADQTFPENEFATIENQEIRIKRQTKPKGHQLYDKLDEELKSRMIPISILDIITHTEKWLSISKKFGYCSPTNLKLSLTRG